MVCETKVVKELILMIVLTSHHAGNLPLVTRLLLRDHPQSFSTELTRSHSFAAPICLIRADSVRGKQVGRDLVRDGEFLTDAFRKYIATACAETGK